MSKQTNTAPVVTDLPTVADYMAADRSGRAKFRAACDRIMRERLDASDLVGAIAAKDRLAEFKSASGAASAPTPVDWNAVTRSRIDTLRHAAYLLESGAVTIDGTPDEFTYVHDDEILPEPDDDAARTLATKRATRRGPTNDVAEGIRGAFASEPDGTFLTVAEIGRRWIANGGPANNSGRIAARLFADVCTVTGVTPVESTTDTPKGARKVGDWS